MISKELEKIIISKMDEKQIKVKNQKYLYKYIELNIQLFSFLDIELLIERLIENFEGIHINFESLILYSYGEYSPTTGKILISPKLFFGKNKKYKDSVIFHELDHCACSPISVKKEFKNYINKRKEKYKKFFYIIPNFILKYFFLKTIYSGPISGIVEYTGENSKKIKYGTNWENCLNEGITSFKQEIYSKKLNIDFHYNQDFYEGGRMGAKCVGDIIGIEKLIYLHFNNNIAEIEKSFFQKTGLELEYLILKCLEYDKSKSKKKRKKLENIIIEIQKKVQKTTK